MQAPLMGSKRALKLLYINVFPMDYQDPKETECLWVLSTGRCGTLTMSQLLDVSPNMVCLHEPLPRYLDYYAEAIHPFVDDAKMKELVRFGRIDTTSTTKAMGYWYAEAGHHMTTLAPYIKSVYPKAKFIYLRRDLDGYVQSAFNWNLYNPKLDKYLGFRPVPPGDLKGSRQKVAWLWCLMNQCAIEFLKTIPRDDWYFLDFDNIKNHNLGGMWEKLKEWGIESPTEDEVNQILFAEFNRGRRQPVKKNWQRFDKIAERIGEFK